MKEINAEKLNKTLEARIQNDLSEGRISCADIIVKQNSQYITRITAGTADTSKGFALPRNSMFRLASMTKPVTGVAVLIGVQNGWFGLEDDLSDHLPQFANMKIAKKDGDGYRIAGDAKKPLKIWHLLTHVNGIMTELDLGYRIYEKTPRSAFESLQTMTDYCATQPLNYEPERFSSYSGYCAFDIAARLIEIKSGMPYADFCRKYIFEPLDLSDMTFCPTDQQWARMVKVHCRTEGRTMIPIELGRHLYEGFPLSYTCAGAGLASTAENYSRFAEMLLNEGSLDGTEILRPEIFAEFAKLRVSCKKTRGCEKDNGWGLGVRVVEGENYPLPVGSYGWSGAYGCHFWVDPVNKITAVYLRANMSYADHGAGDVKAIFEKDVMDALF